MENKDTYHVINKRSEGFYKEKGSKFYAYAIPCTTSADAKAHIDNFRKRNPNACHVCFAWRFGTELYEDRYSDDGEPNNSAGKPIFGQILSYEVTNVLIAVVRVYGGVNLGVGGLVTAYKTAAKLALSNAKIVTKTIQSYYLIKHDYADTGIVMSLLNKRNATIKNQRFENNEPAIEFSIARADEDLLKESLEPFPNLELTFLNTK